MATLRLYFQNERVGPQFRRATKRAGDRVRAALRQTATAAASEIERRGRNNIRNAPGNWGSRWTTGLHARVTEGGGNIRLAVFHDIPYYNVFERGALIRGRPLLWIPLSFASDAKGVNARDYPGRLFRVDRRAGAPLLLSYESKEPKYFGKSSVIIPKKFRVTEIGREVARKFNDIYKKHYARLRT